MFCDIHGTLDYCPECASGWISVKDRLPREGSNVLSADKFGRVYHSIYRANRFRVVFHCDEHGDVTHWMPLPEPPKEISNE